MKKSCSCFPQRRLQKTGAPWCRACFKANWDIRYYENHQHYCYSHNTSRRKIREENARKVFEYLSIHHCIGCDESDPVVLEFDHRDRAEKSSDVASMIFNSSWQKIELEIEKCDVICANCHQRKSAAEFKYKRHVFLNS